MPKGGDGQVELPFLGGAVADGAASSGAVSTSPPPLAPKSPAPDALKSKPPAPTRRKPQPDEAQPPAAKPVEAPEPEILSVAKLDRLIKRVIEGATADVLVRGEVSGLRRAPSGHC